MLIDLSQHLIFQLTLFLYFIFFAIDVLILVQKFILDENLYIYSKLAATDLQVFIVSCTLSFEAALIFNIYMKQNQYICTYMNCNSEMFLHTGLLFP